MRMDMPFKVGKTSTVILKSLPVLECGACPEYLITEAVTDRLDEILARVDSSAELEITRFADKTVATGSIMGLINRGWERGEAQDAARLPRRNSQEQLKLAIAASGRE